ncbi:acetyltransferase [Chlamydia abortus]|uniref:GNAT family N-acetyltransferase n=1 Tax=Paenibacillus residui TaxID=629724 RepID=A0ABW3D4A1_9BACL|nr:GNAT family N-acetyltransferase [Paenibacillus sp. 32O-W]SHE13617.1 acetyltransferase [Chlamydia abortus]
MKPKNDERFYSGVELRPVDHDNWYDCTQIQVTDEQQTLFPVPAVYWLAESAYCGYSPLAIYSGTDLVGLAIYAIDPEDGQYWIMAFVIDRQFQGKGLGRAGLTELIRYMKEKHACEYIILGHRPGNDRASGLYESLGFVEIDRSGTEIIRRLKLT